jgi:hypothetical protein
MNTLLLTLAVMASTAFGQVLFAQSPPTQISGSWLIDVRTLCAVGGVVLLGTWRIGRWMKRIEDRLDDGDTRFSRIELSMKERHELLRDIERKMDRLPCGDSDCPEHKKGKGK